MYFLVQGIPKIDAYFDYVSHHRKYRDFLDTSDLTIIHVNKVQNRFVPQYVFEKALYLVNIFCNLSSHHFQ